MGLRERPAPAPYYQFGEWLLDTQQATLTRGDDAPMALRKLAIDVLVLLLQRAPNLVSKDELLAEIWGRQAISENVIPQVIKELRQTLGDSAKAPSYIETRPKQGYRVIPVAQPLHKPGLSMASEAVRSVAVEPVAIEVNERITPARAGHWLLGVVALLILGLTAYLMTATKPDPDQVSPLAQAALSLNYPPESSLPPNTSFADALIVADGMFLRGDLPAMRALMASLRTRPLTDLQSAQLDVVSLRLAGRDFEALNKIESLLAVMPESVSLQLQRLELSPDWGSTPSPSVWSDLREQLPPERAELIDARISGAEGNADQQERSARSALELAGDHAPLLRELARGELAAALAKRGSSEEALAVFEQAESDLRRQGYERAALLMSLRRAEVARRVGGVLELEAELAPFDGQLVRTQDAALRAKLTQTRGVLLGNGGRYEESLALLEVAVKMFIRLGDHLSASSALNATSAPLSQLGRIEQVAERLSEAQKQAALAGHPQSEGAITGNFSLYYWRRGEVASAVREMRRALRLFEAADRANDVAQAQHNLATMLRVAGETAEVKVLRDLSLNYTRAHGQKSSLATRLLARAEDAQSVGDFAAALADHAEATAIYAELEDTISLKAASCILGLWLLDNDELVAASERLDLSRLEAAPTANQSACISLQARILTDQDRADDAIASLEQTLAEQLQAGRILLALQSQLLGVELRLDSRHRLDEVRITLTQLQAIATQTGNGSLERDSTLQWLRLQYLSAAEGEIALALSQAERALKRYPDRVAQLTLDCLLATAQPPSLRPAAQAQCRNTAHQQKQLRLSRRLLGDLRSAP